MIKQHNKNILEWLIISVIWLVPSLKTSFDYRIIVSFVSFLSILAVNFFVNKKGYAFIMVAAILIFSCLIYNDNFFISVLPAILLCINRYYINGEKSRKKSYDVLNPILTGTGILLTVQIILLIFKGTKPIEIVWNSKIVCYYLMYMIVLCVPYLLSFRREKSNKGKNEKQIFRVISLMSAIGVTVTTYSYILYKSFYSFELYCIYIYPWFAFIYLFIKNSDTYKVLVFEKADKLLEKVTAK